MKCYTLAVVTTSFRPLSRPGKHRADSETVVSYSPPGLRGFVTLAEKGVQEFDRG